MCGETDETIIHIVKECSKLALREYKRMDDNVARMVHWILCEKCNLEKSEKLYLHNPLIGIKINLHTTQRKPC